MPRAYAPTAANCFMLPDGSIALMSDIVTVDNRARYIQEVRLLQQALGVKPDGIIGPKTRAAARDLPTNA